jgi:hypothetical protein
MRSYLQCTAEHLTDFVEKRRHPRQAGILDESRGVERPTSQMRQERKLASVRRADVWAATSASGFRRWSCYLGKAMENTFKPWITRRGRLRLPSEVCELPLERTRVTYRHG